MSLNAVPSGERIHIGIFGRRNAGKSSLINAITGQKLSIVSDVKGTTTDPVQKSMELLPLGPVVLIDTPGLDDLGELGKLRIQKATQMLQKTDLALLVVDGTVGASQEDLKIFRLIKEKEIPCIIAVNKCELLPSSSVSFPEEWSKEQVIFVSALKGIHIQELKELMGTQIKASAKTCPLVSDLIEPEDYILLVIPIDKAAPKGRLILPQQQTIRDILDKGGIPILVRDKELQTALNRLETAGTPPALVITDSQIFPQVAAMVPENIPLTSFSILFARYKGNLETAAAGASVIDTLEHDDLILISEGCTHHRQCGDIGTQKLPKMLQAYTGKKLKFAFTSGTEFPSDLSPYRLIIHCGGCMLNEREMKYRQGCAKTQNIPITNYGIAIAHMKGILARSLAPFKQS